MAICQSHHEEALNCSITNVPRGTYIHVTDVAAADAGLEQVIKNPKLGYLVQKGKFSQ